jgi:TonB family protein
MVNGLLPRLLPFLLTLSTGMLLGGLGRPSASNSETIFQKVERSEGCRRNSRFNLERGRFSQDAARILVKPSAALTPEALRNGTTGTVRLSVMLSSDGVVRDIRVLEGLPDGLTESAIDAASRVVFRPAEVDGFAVSQRVELEYPFDSQEG